MKITLMKLRPTVKYPLKTLQESLFGMQKFLEKSKTFEHIKGSIYEFFERLILCTLGAYAFLKNVVF